MVLYPRLVRQQTFYSATTPSIYYPLSRNYWSVWGNSKNRQTLQPLTLNCIDQKILPAAVNRCIYWIYGTAQKTSGGGAKASSTLPSFFYLAFVDHARPLCATHLQMEKGERIEREWKDCHTRDAVRSLPEWHATPWNFYKDCQKISRRTKKREPALAQVSTKSKWRHSRLQRDCFKQIQ